jgi:hypothetical protein
MINSVFNILEIGFAEKVFRCLKLTRSGGNVKTSKIAALHCDSRKSTQSIFIPFIPVISRIHCNHFYPTSNGFLNAVEKYKAQIYYRSYFIFFLHFLKRATLNSKVKCIKYTIWSNVQNMKYDICLSSKSIVVS